MRDRKTFFRECPVCGGNLDPGELCDCQKEPERKVVTREDWAQAGDFIKAARPGDLVEAEIVDEMVNCLPPATLRSGCTQMGEPYSHELDTKTGRWRATYITFKREADGWVYCGCCFQGDTTQPAALTRRMAI